MTAIKKLLFVHNSFPASGASGNVVFLRHFINLGPEWDIHIVVPARLKDKAPDYYPSNFYISYLPERKWFWPPFREKTRILRKIRVFLWKWELGAIVQQIGKIDSIITVLMHYTSEACIEYAHEKKINSIVFLHDRWDLQNKNADLALSALRRSVGNKVLGKASTVFSVTRELSKFYGEEIAKKTKILYPIPHGSAIKACWKDEFSKQTNIIHAGTINTYLVPFFDFFANKILVGKDQLQLIYVWMDFLDELLKKYPGKVGIVEFFKKNEDAISYVASNGPVMLLYYGLDDKENTFALDSFPSKFIEFSHTGIPIICIAPENSAFYKFLKAENYSLLFDKQNFDQINALTLKLKDETLWKKFADETLTIAEKYFLPEKIQNTFERVLK